MTLPEATPGRHEWIAVASWRLADPGQEMQQLDLENLLSMDRGCLHCERPYSPELAGQPCEGEPS